jgi:anti-sigma regulatory factor (Ser/Thr protein kinase)
MPSGQRPSRQFVRFPNARRYVASARRMVASFGRGYGLSERESEDLACAVGEALANVAPHGFRSGSYFSVRCCREGNSVIVEIEDDRGGFNPYQYTEFGERSMRGYGMTIMRALVDEVAFEQNGRLIRFRKLINGRKSGASAHAEQPDRTA